MAFNPGDLSDSRALRTNTPARLSRLIIQPFRALLPFMNPLMRTTHEAGVDAADLALNRAYPNMRGYFTLLQEDESSPESRDKEKQQRLLLKSLKWARITQSNTVLHVAVE